jgi:ribosomal protein S18 acetylase RimI-like enzyme
LLAVNPKHLARGYGKFITWHLIGQAALLVGQPGGLCHDVLFLEVYVTNKLAIALYEKCGFTKLRDDPIFVTVQSTF